MLFRSGQELGYLRVAHVGGVGARGVEKRSPGTVDGTYPGRVEIDRVVLDRGRVVRVEKTTETRNWSDTMDYSDYRFAECTWALVYLGTHGVPPRNWHNRVITHHSPASWETPRDLTVGERFAWVDCTNLFSDRNGYFLEATEDTVGDLLLAGGTESIYDQLASWEAHHAAIRAAADAEVARKEAERKAAAQIEADKKAAQIGRAHV